MSDVLSIVGVAVGFVSLFPIIVGLYKWVNGRRSIKSMPEPKYEANCSQFKSDVQKDESDVNATLPLGINMKENTLKDEYQIIVSNYSPNNKSFSLIRYLINANEHLDKKLYDEKIQIELLREKIKEGKIQVGLIKKVKVNKTSPRELPYQKPPRLISFFAGFVPKEFREFQQEIVDYVRDGISERANNRISKKLFIISEGWHLVLSVGKWKLFGFALKRRKSIQPPP